MKKNTNTIILAPNVGWGFDLGTATFYIRTSSPYSQKLKITKFKNSNRITLTHSTTKEKLNNLYAEK